MIACFEYGSYGGQDLALEEPDEMMKAMCASDFFELLLASPNLTKES